MPHNKTHFSTKSIHAGRAADSSSVPIYQGVTSPAPSGEPKYLSGDVGVGGPTVEAFEALMTELESAEFSIATPSGMSAIALTFLSLLKTGDRIVAHRCIYSYATRLLNEDLVPNWGIEIEWVDMRDLSALEAALQKPTRLVYFEPIANPSMHLLDVPAIAQLAHDAGVIVAVDNTLLSPAHLQPLNHQIDLVIHSATKYLGGHGDALAGVISGRSPSLREQLTRMRRLLGIVLSPNNASLMIRGIRTLTLRMAQHSTNTQAVADFLQTRPEVAEVRYAKFDAKPTDTMSDYGALLGFTLQPQLNPRSFRDSLQLCRPWGSLGDVETLVTLPAADPIRDIPPNYVRVALGLEHPTDIIDDLTQAFNALS